ncbi:MAG: hypothetical protein CL947_00235 [Epsilonproteobacteria bacterium]|nr:hypothetical protein [Campylobacterota bacterium]|tara:strand:- start:5542 stop:6684 length:1143 start_codon:yes stop_codon:yes gene_type:complete
MFSIGMVVMNIILLCLLLCHSITYADIFSSFLPEYKGYEAYSNKNFAVAYDQYGQLVEQDPYNAEYNYNMGTVLYKQQKFVEAQYYFQRTAESLDVTSDCKEQAYFNLGNSYIQLKKYRDAIEAYEQVLKLHTNNDRARHNLEIAKRLLDEEQKQQEQNQNKQDQQQDNSQEQQKNEQNKQQEQEKNNDTNNKQSDEQKQEESKQEKDQQDKDQQDKSADNKKDSDQEQEQKHNKEDKKEGKNSQSQHESDQQKQQEQSQSDQKDQQLDSKDDTSNELQKQKEQPDKDGLHQKQEKKQQQQSDSDTEKEDDIKKEQQADSSLEDQYAAQMGAYGENDERLDQKDARLMELLGNQEDAIQKQLLRMNVSKQGNQKHGQKNW